MNSSRPRFSISESTLSRRQVLRRGANGALGAAMLGAAFPSAVSCAETDWVKLEVLVHIHNIGDRVYPDGVWAGGNIPQSSALEGFSIALKEPAPGFMLEYMAHLSNFGDTGWVRLGRFVGTRGQDRQMEGFAIRSTGALGYSVRYKAQVQNEGPTPWSKDGAFCGTRGRGLRCEGMIVQVLRT